MTAAQRREALRRLEVGINAARFRLLDPALQGESRAATVEELQYLRLARAGVDGGPRQRAYLRMNGVGLRRPRLRRPGGAVSVR